MSADHVHPLIQRGRDAVIAGDLPTIVACAEARLREAPNDLDALELRALAQIRTGDQTGAVATQRAALAIDPACDWAAADLVLLLTEMGDRSGAEAAARTALAARPDTADLHNLLGALLSEQDDLPDGERHLRRALTLAGPHPHVLRNLAVNLTRQGRHDEADPLFAQAHRAAPRDAEVLAHWARLHEARGDFERAHALLEQAEARGADVRLQRAVTIARQGDDLGALAVIDGMEGDPGGDALLERGRLLERLGRYDEAWDAYASGKRKLAAKLGVSYDAADVEARFERFARARAPHTLAAPPRAGAAQPVFILGFPRTGTTMLEQMLSSHSAVRAGGELPFMHECAAVVEYPLLADDAPARARDFYLQRAKDYGLVHGALFTDKMPLNETWLPLIRLAFPRSPALRMLRHPLDVCVSIFSHHMTHGEHCGYRIADIAAHLAAVEALMARYADAGIAPEVVRYEDFVSRQDAETRRALDVCGLAFEPACLRFHENPRHAPTPSYAQVTAPLNDSSVGRWKRFSRQLEPIVPALAPVIERLGYPL
ncbi:MAG TPA: sulfotransferase [Caulobacterales bacterium]|nr:sulfotransferase [Caulobacterales bacterium]